VVEWPDRRFLTKSISLTKHNTAHNPAKGKTSKGKDAKPTQTKNKSVAKPKVLAQKGPLATKRPLPMFMSEGERNTVAHDVRHDLDYDNKKPDHEMEDRKNRRDTQRDIPISEYSAFVIDPKSYHPSTPYKATSAPTSVVSFKFQTVVTSSPDSLGSFSLGVQLGQACEASGAVVFGGLLPNENTGAPPGAEYANFQVTGPPAIINTEKNIFANVGPLYPAESSFKSFCETMEKHFSGTRLIAARLSLTPLAPSLTRDGLVYMISCPKGGTTELGPNNTDPTEADFVNMPKIFSCPGMKTMPVSDGDTISAMWYPKDDDSFEFIPSRQTFSSGDWKRKYRSGALIALVTGMSSPQTFLIDYELFYQSIPSNATFNITGSSLSLGNPIKQSDAMNLFLTNSNVHITSPERHLLQNFESRDVNVERGRTLLFHAVTETKPRAIPIENYSAVARKLDGNDNSMTPIKAPTSVYGRAQASAITSPGGGSSGTAIGRKITEILKKTIPVVDVVDSFISAFF
jgi:hypothetical protein